MIMITRSDTVSVGARHPQTPQRQGHKSRPPADHTANHTRPLNGLTRPTAS